MNFGSGFLSLMKDWPLFCDVKVNFSTSTIINSLLKLKDLSGAEITKIKRDLIFRSELLSTLCTYFFKLPTCAHSLFKYIDCNIRQIAERLYNLWSILSGIE